MKVRMKTDLERPFSASKFNVLALAEVIGLSDCFYIKDLDVFIEAKNEDGEQIGWKDMRQAFKDHDIIVDNYNIYFFEPRTKEDKERGYTL